MKHILHVLVILMGCVTVFISPAFAEETLDPIRSAYGFDAWPGKKGDIKKEPALDPLHFPGYILIRKTTGSVGTTYMMGEAPDNVRVSITVKTYDSAVAAHAGLLGVLGGFSMILPSAESKNFKIGDAGFVINENDMFAFVAFVKNNITVVVKNIAPDKPNAVRDIASQVDLMI